MNHRLPCLLLSTSLLAAAGPALVVDGEPPGVWQFTEVTADAGLDYLHGYNGIHFTEHRAIGGGVAAGDVNGDGYVDLYAVRGNIGPNLLFINRADGTFEERGAEYGLDFDGLFHAGPLLVDLDGDRDLDLVLGNVEEASLRLLRNDGGSFVDVTDGSGIPPTLFTYSATAADYDRDGDLDLFLTHWVLEHLQQLWRNDGGFRFTDVTLEAIPILPLRDTFTANFADLDADGWPDLLVAADFGASEVLMNQRDGTFRVATTRVISDENGMGAAVGDYDNDGDLDWFVSSIWDPDDTPEGNWGVTGNRLYRNRGDGTFDDVTTVAGVRKGFWGWGSCFADFNNDGALDLFHVNGFPTLTLFGQDWGFGDDPSRLFVSEGDGTFTERSAELGLIDGGQGRGVVCFDYDRDGDVDVFVARNSDRPGLFRNDGGNGKSWLTVRVRGHAGNSEAIGARVVARLPGGEQVREVRAGNNFASHNPAEVHFGLAGAAVVDELEVTWPSGYRRTLTDVATRQVIVVTPERVFDDGFEGGTAAAWSSVVPPLREGRR